MIGARKNKVGLRIESLSLNGHQVVVSYNDDTNEATIEVNGSIKLSLVETGWGTVRVYGNRGVELGEIHTCMKSLDPRFAFAYLTERDLEG